MAQYKEELNLIIVEENERKPNIKSEEIIDAIASNLK